MPKLLPSREPARPGTGDSARPLAEAIVKVAKRRAMPELKATNFAALPGRGAKATVDGKSIEIGGPRLLTEAKIAVSPVIEKSTTAWESGSKYLAGLRIR